MSRILVFVVWAGAALFWGGVQLAHTAGWRINHTASLPTGLWRVSPITRPIARGDIVNFCPPDTPIFRLARGRGYIGQGACPEGYEPLLKPVAAVAGDVVEISAGGISVNGEKINQSAVLGTDQQGRAMPRQRPGMVVVATGELWLISNYNPASFDSRYFGAVPIGQVAGIAARP